MSNARNKPAEGEGSITPRDRDVYFEKDINFEVPYSRENINRCRCPQCPVQAGSKCAKDKRKSSKKGMENMPEGEVPYPEAFPGIYCSTGEATCEDLNSDRQCLCNTCDVWKGYALGGGTPSQYFCKNGRAT